MKRTTKSILAALLAVLMLLSLCACGGGSNAPASDAPASAAPVEDDGQSYTLRLGTFPGDTMTFMEKFAQYVSEESNGRLTIEVMNFLTLGTPADAVVMTKDGSLDMMTISGTEYCGYEPCSAVVAVPLTVSNTTDAFALEKAMLEEGYFSDWDGEVLSMMLTDMQYIALANKKVESASDFSGLIGRCQNANGVEVLKNLGSSITTISTNEVYMSLETGVIDFSVSSPTNMVSSAYGEVVDYIVDQPLYCDVNCLVMNHNSYNSLPASLQEVLKSCGEKLEKEYQEWLGQAEADSIQSLKDAGVEFIPCPEDVLTTIDAAGDSCMESFLSTLGKAGVDTAAFKSFVDSKLS